VKAIVVAQEVVAKLMGDRETLPAFELILVDRDYRPVFKLQDRA
jgi:hypothetical protein